MDEIKVNMMLAMEIGDLKGACYALSSSFTPTRPMDGLRLETVNRYMQEQSDIKLLIDIYQKLLQQDLQDLMNMVEHVSQVDEKLGNMISYAGDRF